MRQTYRLGGVICAALGAAEAVWVGQDLTQFRAEGALRVWTGLGVPVGGAPLITSTVDLLLLGLYAAGAVAAFRPGGVGVLGAAAVITLALRTPAALLLAPASGGVLRGLQGPLLLTAGGQVAGAFLLLLVVRRNGTDAPVPPRPAAGVLAGLLLLVAAAITGIWEFTRTHGDPAAVPLPPSFLFRTAVGGYLVNSQLGAPFDWQAWASAALAAAAGAAALARAPFSRPLGISVACLLGAVAVPVLVTFRLQALSGADFAAGFSAAAAVVAVLLLIPRRPDWDGGPEGDPFADAEVVPAADNLSMPLFDQTAVLPVVDAYGPPPGVPPGEARAAYLREPPFG